jgi:hypothetical protein
MDNLNKRGMAKPVQCWFCVLKMGVSIIYSLSVPLLKPFGVMWKNFLDMKLVHITFQLLPNGCIKTNFMVLVSSQLHYCGIFG